MTGFFPHTSYTSLKWPEILSGILLIIGFILSLSTGSAVMYYIVAFLTGLLFGRLWYKTRNTLQFKYFMMMTFFMIGFVIGNWISHYGDPKLTILIYLLGIIVSYFASKKGMANGVDF